MKVKAVRLYQAIPVGNSIETFLQASDKLAGLEMEWSKGLLKIKTKSNPEPLFVPPANIMWFRPTDKDAKVE